MFRIAFEAPDLTLYVNKTSTTPDNLAGALVEGNALIVEAMEYARADLDDLVGMGHCHLRIRKVEGNLNDLVLPVVARFRRQAAVVTFDLRVTSSDRIGAALLDGKTDLNVVFNPPGHPDLQVVTTVMDVPHAIVHPGGLEGLRRGSRVLLIDLIRFPLELPDETFGLRNMIDGASKAAGISLAPVMITDSIDALRGFARSGIGVAPLPPLSLAKDLRSRSVKAFPIADQGLRVAKSKVFVNASRILPAAARILGDSLATVVRNFSRSAVA
jgi:DNA-binding transcriptional LysR family regulator